MVWAAVVALWLLFMASSREVSRLPKGEPDEVPMIKCPACGRYTTTFEGSDFDGVNTFCTRCRAFIGIRPLGSDPSELRLMDYGPEESWQGYRSSSED
jgi:hypothetical protein